MQYRRCRLWSRNAKRGWKRGQSNNELSPSRWFSMQRIVPNRLSSARMRLVRPVGKKQKRRTWSLTVPHYKLPTFVAVRMWKSRSVVMLPSSSPSRESEFTINFTNEESLLRSLILHNVLLNIQKLFRSDSNDNFIIIRDKRSRQIIPSFDFEW